MATWGNYVSPEVGKRHPPISGKMSKRLMLFTSSELLDPKYYTVLFI